MSHSSKETVIPLFCFNLFDYVQTAKRLLSIRKTHSICFNAIRCLFECLLICCDMSSIFLFIYFQIKVNAPQCWCLIKSSTNQLHISTDISRKKNKFPAAQMPSERLLQIQLALFLCRGDPIDVTSQTQVKIFLHALLLYINLSSVWRHIIALTCIIHFFDKERQSVLPLLCYDECLWAHQQFAIRGTQWADDYMWAIWEGD